MKLTNLEPFMHRYERRVETYNIVVGDPATWRDGDPTKTVTGPREYLVPAASIAEAHGIMFLCPKCFEKNGGSCGTHYCLVSFHDRGLPPEAGSHNREGQPVRWHVSGTGLHDLTTTPSIQDQGKDCGWHGYITNGETTTC